MPATTRSRQLSSKIRHASSNEGTQCGDIHPAAIEGFQHALDLTTSPPQAACEGGHVLSHAHKRAISRRATQVIRGQHTWQQTTGCQRCPGLDQDGEQRCHAGRYCSLPARAASKQDEPISKSAKQHCRLTSSIAANFGRSPVPSQQHDLCTPAIRSARTHACSALPAYQDLPQESIGKHFAPH